MAELRYLKLYSRPHIIQIRCAFCSDVFSVDVSEYEMEHEAKAHALWQANQGGWLVAIVGDGVFACCGRCLSEHLAILLIERFLDGR